MALSDARSKLVRRLHRRKSREREGLVLVEGPHAAAEALASGVEVRFAITSERADAIGEGDLLASIAAADFETHRVDDRVLSELANTESPQGVLLVVSQPDPAWPPHPGGRWLILDAVQDPGNVGALVRAAAAFACGGVVALDGTADPWGAKAVRASAGAAFRVPVHVVRGGPTPELLRVLPGPLLAAEMSGGDPRQHAAAEWTLVVGNEGSGIRPALLDAAAARVAVPMPGGVESLNAAVAGAILLYALGSS